LPSKAPKSPLVGSRSTMERQSNQIVAERTNASGKENIKPVVKNNND